MESDCLKNARCLPTAAVTSIRGYLVSGGGSHRLGTQWAGRAIMMAIKTAKGPNRAQAL